MANERWPESATTKARQLAAQISGRRAVCANGRATRTDAEEVRDHDQRRESAVHVRRRLGLLRLSDRSPGEGYQRDWQIEERDDLKRDVDRVPLCRLERQQRGRERGESGSVGAELGDAGMRGRRRRPRTLSLIQREREERGLCDEPMRRELLTHRDEQDRKRDADAWAVSAPARLR